MLLSSLALWEEMISMAAHACSGNCIKHIGFQKGMAVNSKGLVSSFSKPIDPYS